MAVEWIWLIFIFAMGGCVGSFLNVVIYRLPLDKSLVHPRSSCPSCDTLIPFYDNIPMISWLILRGKCRKCGSAISIRYLLVELLTAVMFIAVYLLYFFFELRSGMGTFAGGALVEDILASQIHTGVTSLGGVFYAFKYELAQDEEYTVVTKTAVYDAGSLAVAVGFVHGCSQWPSAMTLKLYMDGVQMVETGWLVQQSSSHHPYLMIASKALSGSTECKVCAQNYRAGTNNFWASGGTGNGDVGAAGIGIGSITT